MKFEIIGDKVLKNNFVEALSRKNVGREGAISQSWCISKKVYFIIIFGVVYNFRTDEDIRMKFLIIKAKIS